MNYKEFLDNVQAGNYPLLAQTERRLYETFRMVAEESDGEAKTIRLFTSEGRPFDLEDAMIRYQLKGIKTMWYGDNNYETIINAKTFLGNLDMFYMVYATDVRENRHAEDVVIRRTLQNAEREARKKGLPNPWRLYFSNYGKIPEFARNIYRNEKRKYKEEQKSKFASAKEEAAFTTKVNEKAHTFEDLMDMLCLKPNPEG